MGGTRVEDLLVRTPDVDEVDALALDQTLSRLNAEEDLESLIKFMDENSEIFEKGLDELGYYSVMVGDRAVAFKPEIIGGDLRLKVGGIAYKGVGYMVTDLEPVYMTVDFTNLMIENPLETLLNLDFDNLNRIVGNYRLKGKNSIQ